MTDWVPVIHKVLIKTIRPPCNIHVIPHHATTSCIICMYSHIMLLQHACMQRMLYMCLCTVSGVRSACASSGTVMIAAWACKSPSLIHYQPCSIVRDVDSPCTRHPEPSPWLDWWNHSPATSQKSHCCLLLLLWHWWPVGRAKEKSHDSHVIHVAHPHWRLFVVWSISAHWVST